LYKDRGLRKVFISDWRYLKMRELTEQEKQDEIDFITKTIKDIEKDREIEYSEVEKEQITQAHLNAVKRIYN